MRKYGKSLVAVFAAAAVYAYQALSGDNHIDPAEWVQVAIAAVSAVGVWLVPLAPQARWGKSAVAALLAALQVLTTAIGDGINGSDILLMLITAAGALGVLIAPATSASPGGPAVSVGVCADVAPDVGMHAED